MSVVKQILVLLVLSAVVYGGYAGYGQWKASVAATSAQKGAGQKAAKPKARPGRRAAQVEIATAEKRSMSRIIEAVGTTKAARSVAIKPQADGKIMAVYIKPGVVVASGATLFELDDDIQKADLNQARAELEKADLALKRAAQLKKSRVTAKATVEDLEAARATAQAAVARAERRLADRIIRAPFAGTPSLKQYDVGAQVEQSDVLTTLDDLSSVKVEFGVPEQFFAIAKPGLEVITTSAAWPGREFKAVLSEIDTRIDPVARVFTVRADIANEDGALASGMFMQVSMTLTTDALVTVPEQALVVEGETSYVLTVVDGKAMRRDVVTGAREPGFVSITKGLEKGEAIVVSGLSKIRDGADVKVVTANAETTQ